MLTLGTFQTKNKKLNGPKLGVYFIFYKIVGLVGAHFFVFFSFGWWMSDVWMIYG